MTSYRPNTPALERISFTVLRLLIQTRPRHGVQIPTRSLHIIIGYTPLPDAVSPCPLMYDTREYLGFPGCILLQAFHVCVRV